MTITMQGWSVVLFACCAVAASGSWTEAGEAKPYPAIGRIERVDPRFDDLIPPGAVLEKIAEGFEWSEGPVWVRDGGYLLFSDIPLSLIHI